MTLKMTPALAALAERIYVEAVAMEISDGEAKRSYEDIAEHSLRAAVAFGETAFALTHNRL